MTAFDKHLEEIREVKRQISETNSKQRKHELRRHLNKLLRQWAEAKTYRKQYRQETTK